MKPLNALELPIPCDISQCSFEDAIRVIRDYLDEHGVTYRHGQGSLVIGVEGCISAALNIAQYHGVSVSMNRTYEPDEWSLTLYRDDNRYPVTVWSSGA